MLRSGASSAHEVVVRETHMCVGVTHCVAAGVAVVAPAGIPVNWRRACQSSSAPLMCSVLLAGWRCVTVGITSPALRMLVAQPGGA